AKLDDENVFRVDVELAGQRRQLSVNVWQAGDRLRVRWRGGGHEQTPGQVRMHPRDARATSGSDATGHLLAPMPGKVTQIHTSVGELVEAGQALMVLEAMKMEHTIVAPRAGEIAAVCFAVGELVAEGQELVSLADAGAESDG
ncbi:MAG: acetyl-CoA carboxylase biotin carboxyl carrier protein subunit, partial [Gammaproteobacteria bacterium]